MYNTNLLLVSSHVLNIKSPQPHEFSTESQHLREVLY